VDLEGLFTLGTVVLEYRGYRVTAQSIIPGILEREADLEEYVHRWRSD
jgi:protein TIF31